MVFSRDQIFFNLANKCKINPADVLFCLHVILLQENQFDIILVSYHNGSCMSSQIKHHRSHLTWTPKPTMLGPTSGPDAQLLS